MIVNRCEQKNIGTTLDSATGINGGIRINWFEKILALLYKSFEFLRIAAHVDRRLNFVLILMVKCFSTA